MVLNMKQTKMYCFIRYDSLQDEDDYVDALPAKIENKHKKPRSSVSAEAFGHWNKKGDF